jgi:hypothetical protein
MKDPRNPAMLLNGLPYMSDIVITKGTDPKTFRPSYSVSVLGCKVDGKIELKHLDEVACPYPNQEQFFTAEELAAIKNCPWDLDTVDQPKTPEEVSAMISQFPIDFARREKNDQSKFYLFSSKEELDMLVKVAENEGVQYYFPSKEDVAPALTAPPAQPPVPAPAPVPPPVQPTMQPPAQPQVQPPIQPPVQPPVQPMVAEKVPPVLPSQPSSQNTGQPAYPPSAPPSAPTSVGRKRPTW